MAISYKVIPGAPYYTTDALTIQAGTLGHFTDATYVNTTYGTIVLEQITYYVSFSDMMSFYKSSFASDQIELALSRALNPDTAPILNSQNLITSGAVFSQNTKLNSVSNKNFIDNWYFIKGTSGSFPINQTGQTSYESTSGAAAVDIIDRWKMQRGTVSVTDNGLFCIWDGTNGSIRFDHFIENIYNLLGKTLTFSVLYNNGKLATMTKVADETNTAVSIDDDLTIGINFDHAWNKANRPVQIFFKTEENTLQAAKLEIGSEQTLCHNEGTSANPVWVLNEIPDYKEELWKCQRYLVKFSGSTVRYNAGQITPSLIDFIVPLPVPMYGHSGTLTAPSLKVYYGAAGTQSTSEVTDFTFSVSYIDTAAFCIRVIKQNHGCLNGGLTYMNLGNGDSSPAFLRVNP